MKLIFLADRTHFGNGVSFLEPENYPFQYFYKETIGKIARFSACLTDRGVTEVILEISNWVRVIVRVSQFWLVLLQNLH